jgi:hypothetical protein
MRFTSAAQLKAWVKNEARRCDVLTMPAPLDERDGSIPITTLLEIPGWQYYWFANILT